MRLEKPCWNNRVAPCRNGGSYYEVVIRSLDTPSTPVPTPSHTLHLSPTLSLREISKVVFPYLRQLCQSLVTVERPLLRVLFLFLMRCFRKQLLVRPFGRLQVIQVCFTSALNRTLSILKCAAVRGKSL